MGDLKCIGVEEITQTRSEVEDCRNRSSSLLSNEDAVSSPASERGLRKEERATGHKKKLFFRGSELNPNAHNQRHRNNKTPTSQGRVTKRIAGGTPLLDDAPNEVENITTKQKKEKKLRKAQRKNSRHPTSCNGFDQMVPVAVLSSDLEEVASIASDLSGFDTSASYGHRSEEQTSIPHLHKYRGSLSDNVLLFDSSDASPTAPDWLCYGDEIRLRCYSAFEKNWSYLGYSGRSVQKRNAKAVGKGDLFMLPPVPKSRDFHESAFKLFDPLGEREDGEPLHYGDVLTFSDERGMVWNNKSGRLHGLLGPSTYGYGGQMHITFSPKMETEEGTGCKRGEEVEDSNPSDGKVINGRVRYGDNFLVYAKKLREKKSGIIRSAVTQRRRKKYGVDCGVFLRSDGKGIPLLFCVHRAPPRISIVTIYGQGPSGSQTETYYNVPWEQELELNIPCGLPGVNSLIPPIVTPKSMHKHHDTESINAAQNKKPLLYDHGWLLPPPSSNVICVTFSNGGKVMLELQDLMDVGTVDKYRWFNVTDCIEEFRLKVHIHCLDAGDGNKGAAIWTFFIAALVASIILTALKALLIFCSSAHYRSMVGEISLSGKAIWLSLEIASMCVSMLLASSLKDLMEKKKDGLSFTVMNGSSSHCYVVSFIKCENGRAEDISPDDEGLESRIPPTFMEAESGDLEKAEKRWKATMVWRRHVSADDALTTPHYKFDICKRFYPSAFHGLDKTGAVVYYERLGGIDIESLKAQGVTQELLGWHYMWQMEYLWMKISPSYDGRVTIILDMKGVRIGDIKGEASKFLRATVSMLERHYPARSDCINIINVPWWFDVIWKLVKPLLSEETRRKINPYDKSCVQDALLKIVDEDQLPKEYGGSCTYEFCQHPMEMDMRQHVLKIISKNGLRKIDEITTKCNVQQSKCDQQSPMHNKQREVSTPG